MVKSTVFSYDFRAEVDNELISGMAVDNVGVDVPIKVGDSRSSNGFRDSRTNKRTNGRTLAKHMPIARNVSPKMLPGMFNTPAGPIKDNNGASIVGEDEHRRKSLVAYFKELLDRPASNDAVDIKPAFRSHVLYLRKKKSGSNHRPTSLKRQSSRKR